MLIVSLMWLNYDRLLDKYPIPLSITTPLAKTTNIRIAGSAVYFLLSSLAYTTIACTSDDREDKKLTSFQNLQWQ